MFSGIVRRCQWIIQRVIYENGECRRQFASRWHQEKASEEEPITISVSKFRKRVKHRKPDWITDKVLFIANVPKMSTKAEIFEYFSQVGFVSEVRKFEYAPFAWVIFENKRHADRARREYHGSIFQGKGMVVYEGRREGKYVKPIPEVVSTC